MAALDHRQRDTVSALGTNKLEYLTANGANMERMGCVVANFHTEWYHGRAKPFRNLPNGFNSGMFNQARGSPPSLTELFEHTVLTGVPMESGPSADKKRRGAKEGARKQGRD